MPRRTRTPAVAVAAVALLGVAAIGTSSASALSVTDAFKYGYQAFTKYRTCMANIDAGQPCLATDSANIRQILKDVKALRAEIQANHKSVTDQINLVQKTLDEKTRNDYVTLLNPVTLQVTPALTAWQGMAECNEALQQKKATCAGQGGAAVPARKGADDWQKVLVYRVDLMNDNILSTAAVFSGTSLAGDQSGLAAADWMLNKRVQDTKAGVTDNAWRTSVTVPVATPELANATTKFVDTYDDYLESYGMLKPFVAGLKGDDAIAEAMQGDVQTAIYGTDEYSVASRTAYFSLPALQRHEIAFVDPGNRSTVYVVQPGGGHGYLMNPSLMFSLGTAIDQYGTVSTLMKQRPSAFTADGWYATSVRVHNVDVCPRTGTFCTDPTVRVHQLARNGGTVFTTRMRLLDQKPGWDKKYERSAYGTNGVKFDKDFNTFVTGPATYDWYVDRYCSKGSVYLCYEIGPGSWVNGARGQVIVRKLPTVPPMMKVS